MRERWFIFIAILLLFFNSIYSTGLTLESDRTTTLKPINQLTDSTENIKVYDFKTETATIKSPSGLTEYATLKLLTPKNMLVGAGYNKVAEIEIKSKVTYTDFLNKMYFYNLKNNSSPIQRSFDLRQKVDYVEEEIIYEEVCGKTDDKNGSCISYEQRDTGKTRLVNKTRYDLLTEKNFGVESKVVSIWTNVEVGDKVEWIPEFYGTLITEWANWTASLDTNLTDYWKFDEASGNLLNYVRDNNGTNSNITYSQTGIINTAYKYNGNNTKTVLADVNTFLKSSEQSVSVWVYPTSTSATARVIFTSNNNESGGGSIEYRLVFNNYHFQFLAYNNSAYQANLDSGAVTLNQWYHIVVTYKQNDFNLYVNNVLKAQDSSGTVPTNGASLKSYIGVLSDLAEAAYDFNGLIDEMGVWNRILTQAEVNSLYNGGSGLPFRSYPAQAKVDFNVYAVGTTTHITGVTGDCNVNAMDFSGQNSPITGVYQDQNTSFSCNFTASGYDANNSYIGVVDSNKTLVIYMTPAPPQARITWNVYRSGTTSHLTAFSADCNVNAMDLTTQDSPYPSAYVAQNTGATCNFTRTGYDANNNVIVSVDSNKTVTVYLTDSTGPSVGTTVTTGFTILGTQIWGTGTISSTATDTGSDINSTGCYYSINNGSTYALADRNTTHCYKTGIVVTAGTTPQYRFKVFDNANNSTISTASTAYTADNVAPTIGTVQIAGFTTYTTYFKGTGTLSATISDAVSGIASCEYSEGPTWVTADTNATHCYKTAITAVNGTVYDFNIRAYDNATNLGTGTKLTRTGDTLAPVTTITLTDYNNSPYKLIQATCSDAGSGCKGITFEFDTNGTKYYSAGATKDLNFYGLGLHHLTYYSTDNLDTNETPVTIDLNMPTLLTIRYPKNIQTLVQLTEKWILRSTGGVVVNLTDLNSDYNIYVQPNTLTTFYIGDVNGNYTQNTYTKTYYDDSNTGYDTLQPYLYAIATSLATTITTVDARTNLAVPNVTIKVYGNLPGIGNTLIGQATTDSKGQALQLFIAGQAYTFEIYYGGNLLKTYNITAVSSTIVIALDFNQTITPGTTSGYSVRFNPLSNGLAKLTIGNQTLTQTIFNPTGLSTAYTSQIIQNGVVLSNTSYTGTDANKTFTHSIAWAAINTGTLTSRITFVVAGTTYVKDQNYLVNDSFGTNYNLYTGLSSGLRSDLECSSDGICMPLLIIALIITIGLSVYASMLMGQFGSQTTAIIAGVLMIIFTYLTWIPLVLTAGSILVGLAFIINERRN